MNIQRIDSSKSNQNFGMLRPASNMDYKKFRQISSIPVVSSFSKKFDGVLSVGSFISPHSGKMQYSLEIREVEPVGFFEKIRDSFVKHPKNAVTLKTHATNFEEFKISLHRRTNDTLAKIFFNKNL